MSDTQATRKSKLPHERILSAKSIPNGVDAVRVVAACLTLEIPDADGNPVITEFLIGARTHTQVQDIVNNLKCWGDREPLDPNLMPTVLLAHASQFNLDEEL